MRMVMRMKQPSFSQRSEGIILYICIHTQDGLYIPSTVMMCA